MEVSVKKIILCMLGVASLIGCASIQPPVEVAMVKIDVASIKDAGSCYIAGKFFDSSFNPLGFITGSYDFAIIKNADANEIEKIGFGTKDEISVYEIKPGRYQLLQAVKSEPEWVGPYEHRQRVMRDSYYQFPPEKTAVFEIKAGELLYLGRLTPKIGFLQKNTIVVLDDFEDAKSELLKKNPSIADFTLRDLP